MSIEHALDGARLRLRRSRGEARDQVVAIPLEGSGLAMALELGHERLTDAQWRAANHCRIEARDGAWVFVNGSHALVCARNGERIAGGSVTPLQPGDTIEIGLCSFAFENGAPAAVAVAAIDPPPPTPNSTPSPTQTTVPAASEPDDPASFDLRDLAAHASQAPPASASFEDPFGALDIAGARAREPGARLAEVLEDKKPSAERPRDVQVPGSAPAPLGRERADPSTNGGAALFDALEAEFVRVVRDPTQLAGSVDWAGFLAPVHERAGSFERYTAQGASFASVEDILGKRTDVEQVLSRFESLGRSDLLDVAQDDDVLRLFAPELERGPPLALPTLTRREHHAMSHDSHMRLGPVRPANDSKDPE